MEEEQETPLEFNAFEDYDSEYEDRFMLYGPFSVMK